MNWRMASRRVLGLPVIWDAADDAPPALTAAPLPSQAVHYHLHLAPGMDLSGLNLALPPGSAVTTEEEN